MVRAFDAHSHRILVSVIAEGYLAALVRASGVQANELVAVASLAEAEERVLPYGHTVVAIGKL